MLVDLTLQWYLGDSPLCSSPREREECTVGWLNSAEVLMVRRGSLPPPLLVVALAPVGQIIAKTIVNKLSPAPCFSNIWGDWKTGFINIMVW